MRLHRRVAVRSTAIVFLASLLAAPAWGDNEQLTAARVMLAADDVTAQQRSLPAPVVTPEPQRWSIGLGALYTHRRGETAGWAPSVEVNYSVSDRFMLHALAPFAYDHLNGVASHYGLGDVELGFRYRFIDEDPQGWRPSVSIFPLVDFPSGRLSENLGTGRIHAFLPLWISKAFGPWIPYGGGGYWINPGPSNKNWTFVAAGIIRVLSQQWFVTGQVFHATSSRVGIKEQTGFAVGGRYNINANHHVLLTVGRGLQNASATNEFTSYLQYIVTF